MRAMAMTAYDSGLSPMEVPAPEPGDGELCVRVNATSLNRFDVLAAKGFLQGVIEYQFPAVPGMDFAGTVEAIGAGVTRFRPGDEVFGTLMKATLDVGGAWAERIVIAEDGFVAPRPVGLDVVTAAALPLASMAALVAVETAQAEADTTVLIVGGSGGVGTSAVQLAAQRGATVIATAKPDDEERLRSLGASQTMAQGDIDPGMGGIDALIDLVSQSPDQVASLAELVREGGRVVSALEAADVGALAVRGISATNVRANAADPGSLVTLAEQAASGALRITVDTVAFDDLPAAIDRFLQGKRGKIVATVNGSSA